MKRLIRAHLRRLSLLGFGFFCLVCYGGDSQSGSGLSWRPCPAYLEAESDLQCAYLRVPLDHSDRNASSIDVLLMRSLGSARLKKGQIWFLAGGPGESIRTFAWPFHRWARSHPEFDYYAMEHRGTGASTPLLCSTETPSTACRDELLERWGADGLGQFNPTQAAHDLAAAMVATADGRERFLYGFSYGTYLSQRFFRLYDHMISAAVLDGVAPAAPDAMGMLPIDLYDGGFNDIAGRIADLCDQDPSCAARVHEFAADTRALIAQTYAAIRSGTICTELAADWTQEELRQASAIVRNYWGRLLLPAIYYRINRCNASDVAALGALIDAQAESPDSDAALYPAFNDILNFHIVVAELSGGKTLSQVETEELTFIASAEETLQSYRNREALNWPIYSPDAHTWQWADTELPLLLLNGDLDPQTPLSFALETKSHYAGADQYLVTFPSVNHGVLFFSTLPNIPLDAVDTCGTRVMFDFFNDPSRLPDTSCLAEMVKPDFSGTGADAVKAARQYFQSESVW